MNTLYSIVKHIFYWSIIAITIEWLHLKTGNIKYGSWRNMGWSYLTEWILLFIFIYITNGGKSGKTHYKLAFGLTRDFSGWNILDVLLEVTGIDSRGTWIGIRPVLYY